MFDKSSPFSASSYVWLYAKQIPHKQILQCFWQTKSITTYKWMNQTNSEQI